MVPLPSELLSSIVSNTLSIAAAANLVKMVRRNSSSHSTPVQEKLDNSFTAAHPSNPGEVVMLVSELANIFLAGSLLPSSQPRQHPFSRLIDNHNGRIAFASDEIKMSQVRTTQIEQLIRHKIDAEAQLRLSSSEQGRQAKAEQEKTALRWWNELYGTAKETDSSESTLKRRNSVFGSGGGTEEEEIELGVTILVGGAT